MICRACGEPADYTPLFCSNGCMEEFYGESNRELYADERRPYEPEENDSEGDEDAYPS